jgi:hypothetical protein
MKTNKFHTFQFLTGLKMFHHFSISLFKKKCYLVLNVILLPKECFSLTKMPNRKLHFSVSSYLLSQFQLVCFWICFINVVYLCKMFDVQFFGHFNLIHVVPSLGRPQTNIKTDLIGCGIQFILSFFSKSALKDEICETKTKTI